MSNSVIRPRPMGRRAFLRWTSSRDVALGAAGVGLPALLAACGDDDDGRGASSSRGTGAAGATTTSEAQAAEEAEPTVGDVVDFALSSDEWPGDFGFVTLALRPGAFDGNDVWYVRTDTSDAAFAEAEHLVHVPKLAPLTGEGLSGAAYAVQGGPEDEPAASCSNRSIPPPAGPHSSWASATQEAATSSSTTRRRPPPT